MLADNRLSALTHDASNRALLEHLQSQTFPANESFFNEQKDLRSYAALIYRRKWMIVSIVLIVTTLVAVYMYRLPSLYQAETTIRIEQKSESFLRAKDIVINTANDPAYWRTQLRLLENPMLARRVILALDLHHNSSFLSQRARTSLMPSLESLSLRRKTQQASAESDQPDIPAGASAEALTDEQRAALAPYVSTFLANLSIEPVAETNLVKIHFTHASPEIAMKVTDTLAELFILDDVKWANEGLDNASSQLASQIADLQMTIKQQEEERLNYIKNHNLPLGQTKGENLTGVRLDTLSGQLLAAENERKILEAAYDSAIRTLDVEVIPEVQADKGIQEMKGRLRALEQRRAALSVKYTSEWHEVREIEQEINQLKGEIARTSRGVVASLKSRFETALAREIGLRQAYYGELGAANRQSQAEIELGSLNQKIETNKQLYTALFQRQQELQIDQSDRKSNVAISTRSEKPTAPVAPQRARSIIIAFFLSLFAGTALAVLLHQFDDSIKSVDELVAYTNLPNLALIPSMTGQKTVGGKGLAPFGRRKELPSAELLENARSPVAEAFRHLRTSLLFSSGVSAPRSILVTSGQALEGKTTVAFNTAIALAQTGASVLLVDCDLRRPSVQKHIGAEIEPGLTDYLAGEVKLDAALRNYAQLPSLKIMTSGYLPANPAELLGSEEMLSFLSRAKERFAHVIIDSPPSVSFADGAIISTLVDGVVIVVHGGKSSRAVVRHLINRLTGVGARICGTVLNNVKPQPYDYYYNSYYYSYQSEGQTPRAHAKRSSAESSPALDISPGQLEQEFEKFQRLRDAL
ncbi:MAG TPA: polysaccharide biosynthesis tyrosine autokinase [Pyrinomonadaceae bacterium]|nr:polysaccharide biosynthesis tyrosine autokinase [Pyrinomonadaceae bacterium]